MINPANLFWRLLLTGRNVPLLLLQFTTLANFLPEIVNSEDRGPVSCYRTNGADLAIQEVRCAPSLPGSPTYCLKANVYDGRVIRDCASTAQCPQVKNVCEFIWFQGDNCAPITYEEDGTTDFVCCCLDDLCNAAPGRRATLHDANWSLLLALLLLLLIARYGAQFAF